MIARQLVAAVLGGLVLATPGGGIDARAPEARPDWSAAEAVQASSGSPFLPFGPKQLPMALFGRPPFSGCFINMISLEALRDGLAAARRAHMRLIINPVGAYSRFVTADGRFSLQLWKQRLDRVKSFDFAPYVADGTVLGIELMNEPHNKAKWGGVVIPREDVEAAAGYAKSLWPYLPVGAGRSDYVKERAPWRYLDFTHSQYHMRKGDVETWRASTVAEARAAGVGLLLSLNFLGGEEGNTPMTADEVRRSGSVLAADAYACALTGYLYDAQYLGRRGMSEAFEAVAAVARSHPAPPCYIGSVKH